METNNQMSNDTNMDNRILAEFEGMATYEDLECHTDRNALHRVWEKFRELSFEDNAVLEIQFLTHYRQCIRAMSTGTLTDLYTALVQAVKWYNEVAPATEAEYEKGRGK